MISIPKASKPFVLTENTFTFTVPLREYVDIMGLRIVSDPSVPANELHLQHPDGRVDVARLDEHGHWRLPSPT